MNLSKPEWQLTISNSIATVGYVSWSWYLHKGKPVRRQETINMYVGDDKQFVLDTFENLTVLFHQAILTPGNDACPWELALRAETATQEETCLSAFST